MEQRDRTKLIIILASTFLAMVIVAAAAIIFAFRDNDTNQDGSQTADKRKVSREELERSNGRMGQPCLVAVDGTVYEIEGFSLWRDGEHATSEGKAYCGADMSDVIDSAPHGRSKLNLLEVVGPLED